jgi:dTDP-4-dehydrorhamnose reductase
LKLLITGASGLFGSKLAEMAMTKSFEVYSGYNQQKPAFGTPIQLDITNENQVKEVIKKTNPTAVVHAASLTDVDKCETDKTLAWKTNVEGTKHITTATKASHAFLVYISTDYVFNGEAGQYKETDSPDPINYYGLTKLKAEEYVKEITDDYCIARPSVIYGAKTASSKINFALWLLDKLNRNEHLKVVTNQWNSPTLNTSLAAMTLEIIKRKLTGIFHLSGATRISRYDFAKLIAQTFNLNENLIVPSTLAAFSWEARALWAAKRPKDSSLDTSKTQKTLKTKPLNIHEALQQFKMELTKEKENPAKTLSNTMLKEQRRFLQSFYEDNEQSSRRILS